MNKISQSYIKAGSVFSLVSGSTMAEHCYKGPQRQTCYLKPGIWGILVDLPYKLLDCNSDIPYSMSSN